MPEREKHPFEKYEGARVALQYAQAKDWERAGLALRTIPVDNDGRLLLEDQYYSTPQGIASASSIFGNQFNQELGNLTYAQAKEFYSEAIAKLSVEAKAKAIALFDKYAGKKIGDIEAAYQDSTSILNDPKAHKRKIAAYVKPEELDAALEKDLQKAKKVHEEYNSLIEVRQLLQESREESIVRKTRNSRLEQILKE